MIRDGALQNPAPEVIIGQHVHPELPAGSVGLKSGPFMASSDEVRITVHGKGGHAAMPNKLVDPVVTASHIVVSLQQMVSRWANPNVPTVLSFGRIQGNGANNVIPDEVYLEGTFRTFDETWRARALNQLKEMAGHLSARAIRPFTTMKP
jgi:amidohydrolase